MGNTQSGLGDLSFDGTGLLGTGLFGYANPMDTSNWTLAEWAAVFGIGYYGFKMFKGLKRRGRR